MFGLSKNHRCEKNEYHPASMAIGNLELKAGGAKELKAGFRCTLLLQLHFNSFPDAYLVPIELILGNMEQIVLSPIWCDSIKGQDDHQ